MFLKPDTVGFISRGCTEWESASLLKPFNVWCTLVEQETDSHDGNGREVNLPGVKNVKVDGNCEERKEVFEYLGCFWHGCQCMPNRHKPIDNTEGILLNRYEETQDRLQKIRDAGYKVISIWGCEFRKLLCDNPDLKNELCSHPYVKYFPVNIRDALYGGGTEATKTYYRVKGDEGIHYEDVIRGLRGSMWPQIYTSGWKMCASKILGNAIYSCQVRSMHVHAMSPGNVERRLSHARARRGSPTR